MHNKLAQGVYYENREPVLKWDDIAGYPGIKEKVKQLVSLPLVRGKELEKQGIQLPTGVMLWGPLGVGIKMMAEAAASEAKVKLVYVSGREILGKPKELREAFKTARLNNPCVLFVSDTEWIAPQPHADYSWPPIPPEGGGQGGGFSRGKPTSLADREMTTIFLEELDNISGLRDIALVGSCYRIDTVDQCLFKEKSRFNRKIFVPPPSSIEREYMLKFFINKINLSGKKYLNIENIIPKTEGYTGWDMENLCKDAVVQAIQNKSGEIKQEYFDSALERIKPWLTKEMTKKYYELYEQDCPHYYHF
ncbi:MAG: AAA family ATPase [bacterium]|nr:AAA family ATPase [bacterium]